MFRKLVVSDCRSIPCERNRVGEVGKGSDDTRGVGRVLHVFEPGCDGVFTYVDRLTRAQLRIGLRVALAYSSVRGSDQLYCLLRAVQSFDGTVSNLRVGSAPCLGDFVALQRVLSLVRRFKPHVIHCHSSKAGILGRAAAAVRNLPVVYTPNAYYGMAKRADPRTVLFNGLERLFAGLGHTLNVSEDEAAFARQRLGVKPTRQSVIPNAVDTTVFKPPATDDKKSWRMAKGLPADAVILGTLGRLSYQKDPLTLYRAFELLARQRPNVYLAHIGTGELARDCEEWIKQSGLSSRILRMDYSPEPSEFYRVLDAFVLSSRYEGLSFAVLEALATDLPMVLTDVPGNRDFFKLGLSHLSIAPAENPAVLAQAIADCMDLLGNGVPCNHRQIAVERFSEQACFGRILDLYRQLGQRKGTDCLFAPSA